MGTDFNSTSIKVLGEGGGKILERIFILNEGFVWLRLENVFSNVRLLRTRSEALGFSQLQ